MFDKDIIIITISKPFDITSENVTHKENLNEISMTLTVNLYKKEKEEESAELKRHLEMYVSFERF